MNNPPLTMHKRGAKQIPNAKNTSSMQSWKCQKFEDNHPKQIGGKDTENRW